MSGGKVIGQKGAVPLLLLLAVIGIVSFLVVSSTFPLKTKLFSVLFPKAPSHAASNGIPQVDINYGEDVESWWGRHPFNPENPNYIPIGAIDSPQPVFNVKTQFNKDIQAAIDALPAAGGTLFFDPGVYNNSFILAGRSNVHFISNGGAVLLGGNRGAEPGNPVEKGVSGTAIVGCKGETDYGAFASSLYFERGAETQASLNCVNNQNRNIYFKNLIFDGGGNTHYGFWIANMRDVVFDNDVFQNFAVQNNGEGSVGGATAVDDHIWFRGCQFIGSQNNAIFNDGMHGGGIINSRIENKLNSGVLFLRNGDFTMDYNRNGIWDEREKRTGAYIVVYGNTFTTQNVAINMAARNSLIKNNIVEGGIFDKFIFMTAPSDFVQPTNTYTYTGIKVIGNFVKGASSLFWYWHDTGTQSGWNNPSIAGQYTVKDNIVVNSGINHPVDEEGSFIGPNNVTNNCINGILYGTNTVCGSSDKTAPIVSLTGAGNGSTVSGKVNLSANASDNIGIAGVQFKLDGIGIGTEDTTAPYAVAWDTTYVPDGVHTLTAQARDTANNVTTSVGVSVTVSGGDPDLTIPFPSAMTVNNITGNTATVSWTTDEMSDSQVEYGSDINFGSLTSRTGPLTTSHTVSLSGLTTGTTYYYRVKSYNASGNLGKSSMLSFVTNGTPSSPVPSSSPIAGLPAAPTVTKPSCIANGYNGSGVTISWVNPVSPVNFVDISSDSDFTTWANKFISSVTSTTAPNGFASAQTGSPLTLNPNTTYYTRLYNGDPAGNHSAATSFSIPSCTSSSLPSPSTVAKLGDVDGNGEVDIFDYNLLLTNFNKTGTGVQGDINGNGQVDIFDYNLLLTNFGK